MSDMTIEQRLEKFSTQTPDIDPTAVVLPGATIIGAVKLGPQASVFPGAVLRGDIERIEIGEGSNVQDGVVIHLADDLPCVVGKHVTIGHRAMVHACTVGDGCLIGMSATVLDGAVVGAGSIVGAHSLVTKGTQIPPNSLVMGVPARVVRELSETEIGSGERMARKYTVVSATLKKKMATAYAENPPIIV
ncbi:MAG: gamma carbonic anhydrase family protein [Puniceicoccales bacterium]|jgi:carbonic anhydrase/acetyltransferase-like protein (isoleucine patch superfamily)|nr:gamma carbonic anhydrase family protein [Puniceicoccales bacterium]